MAKIVRYEFMGSFYLFGLCCIFVFLLPVGVLYVITNTIRIEEEMSDPEQFAELFREGKLTTR
jgi:hypothetical protein